MPARPASKGRMDRERFSSSSGTSSPTSWRSSPDGITEDVDVHEDLDADSLALIELVEALEEELSNAGRRLPHRRRGPRGPQAPCATRSTTWPPSSRQLTERTMPARAARVPPRRRCVGRARDSRRRLGLVSSTRTCCASPSATVPTRRTPGLRVERAPRVPRRRRVGIGRRRGALPSTTPNSRGRAAAIRRRRRGATRRSLAESRASSGWRARCARPRRGRIGRARQAVDPRRRLRGGRRRALPRRRHDAARSTFVLGLLADALAEAAAADRRAR